jgi:hypothetical protein
MADLPVVGSFDIDNQTFGTLSQVRGRTGSSSTDTAQAPLSIPVGQKATVYIRSTSGSLSYAYGNPLYPITVAWAPGFGGRVRLTVRSPPTSDAGLMLLAMLQSFSPEQSMGMAHAQVPTPDEEADLAREESASDADRLRDPQPAAPIPAPAGSGPPALGVVHLYERLTVRVDNQTGEEIALTSTNADLEVTFANADSGDVTPPPVVESGSTKDFAAYTWPPAFAKYAISKSNWNACWVELRWKGGGVTSRVVSVNSQQPSLQARVSRLPPSGGGTDPIFAVTIERAAAGVPVAPIVGTTRDVYQTYARVTARNGTARDMYTVGHAHTRDRMVLGVDVSAYQPAVDFKSVCDFVDSEGRRVWFASAQCLQPRGANIFASHWDALSRTRLLRFPYVFLKGLDPRRSKNADDATLQTLADEMYEGFKNEYTAAGGWRHYDLPPAVDFEPTYMYRDPADHKLKAITRATASMATPAQRQDAWTLLCVTRTFVRRLTASFGTRPFFYSGREFFENWYPVALLGMAQERPGETWQDSWLDPIFDCRIWHSEYPYSASPTTNPRAWPWPKPRGYTGRWFSGPWDIYQFGTARQHGIGTLHGADATPRDQSEANANWQNLPEADASSLGIAGTQLDLDVWRGSVPELMDLALQARWNEDA